MCMCVYDFIYIYIYIYIIGHMIYTHTHTHIYMVVGARCSSMVRAFAHTAMGLLIDPSWGGPISYFSFEPVLHDWCNKGCGMCYPVSGMIHIKEPLLLSRERVAHVAACFLSC